MKVNEIKEKLEQGIAINEILEIKKFFTMAEKRFMIDYILENILEYDANGMLKVDFVRRVISTNLSLVSNVADIEFEEDFFSDYNYLDEQGILRHIQEEVWHLYDEINELVDAEVNQRKELENSVSAVLNRGLIKFVEVVDKNTSPKQIKSLLKLVSKEFAGFNWDSVPMIKEIYNTVNNDGKVSPIKKKKK